MLVTCLQRLDALLGREIQAGLGEQAVEIPFLVEIRRAMRPDHRVDGGGDDVYRALAEILALHDLDAPGVDHLALLVHHFVVLEDVLADLGVADLDVVLRPLDGPGDHAVLDGHVLGEAAHGPLQHALREQAHQLVFEREEEPALAGVALAAAAAPELVVDPAGLVALRTEHVKPTERSDLVTLGRAFFLVLGEELVETSSAFFGRRGRGPRPAPRSWARPSGLPPSNMSTPRPAMLVATVTACSRPA